MLGIALKPATVASHSEGSRDAAHPPDRSLEHAARARRAYAEHRPVCAALRRGDVSIATVMREQPVGLADRTLFEILLIAHQFGRRRLHALNARAVEENVNLAMTPDVADYDAREWVVRNALPLGRTASRETWATLMAD